MVKHLTTKFESGRESFLLHLSKTGRIYNSAKAAGLSPESIRLHRKEDAGFENAFQLAMSIFRERVEEEIQTRAMDGWDEPVFYQGEEVGAVRRKSDQLLLALAKRHIPEYREKVTVDANIKAGVLVVNTALSPEDWRKKFESSS